MLNNWRYVFDHSVAKTITSQGKETVFDDMICTFDSPSEILCHWIALSNNSTSCSEPSTTCLRVICLLSRCIEKSSGSIVPTLSNISSLIGISLYLDSMWVEDCPYEFAHWTRIMRCSCGRMKRIEKVFLRLLDYRIYVSDDEIQSLRLKFDNTYKSHPLTRQPLLNELTATLSKKKSLQQAEDNMSLTCTEMSVD